MSSYRYQFPETKFVPENTPSRMAQAFKILDEAEEVAVEVYNDGLAVREVEECLDVIVSCETLLRSYPPKIVQDAYDLVVSKNRNRGYWKAQKDLPLY